MFNEADNHFNKSFNVFDNTFIKEMYSKLGLVRLIWESLENQGASMDLNGNQRKSKDIKGNR